MAQPRPVVVIGNFDGVHRGHRALLAAARQGHPDAPLTAVTLWPHPMTVLRPGAPPSLLCDLPERIALLRAAGCDAVEVVAFTARTAQWSPAEFVDVVLRPLRPVEVCVGANFTFGHRALGTPEVLAELGSRAAEAGPAFAVRVVPVVDAAVPAEEQGGAAGSPGRVSSSRIRAALAEGDVTAAGVLLGRTYAFTGTVVRGAQRGRELGFPTANVMAPAGFAVPADGVYAGRLQVLDDADRPAGELWPAAISVGTNPTFDDEGRRVEAYVLDRDDLELYDRRVRIEFVEHLRAMVKFTGIPDLIEQMHDDVDRARALLG